MLLRQKNFKSLNKKKKKLLLYIWNIEWNVLFLVFHSNYYPAEWDTKNMNTEFDTAVLILATQYATFLLLNCYLMRLCLLVSLPMRRQK